MVAGIGTFFYFPIYLIKSLIVCSIHTISDISSADGNYEVTIMTKAILTYTGRVKWNPPAIYKSYCGIDVEYFPFDEQECMMKFGSWTYDGFKVDLKLKAEAGDLGTYTNNGEWDLLSEKPIFY